MRFSFPFSRRQFLKFLLALGAWHFAGPSSGSAAPLPIEGKFDFTKPLIQAPDDPDLWPLFRQKLAQWRKQTRRSSHYSDVRYSEREMAWASLSFSSCFLMLWDSVFYDRQAGQFKVDEFLSLAERDFGGFDNLILWHAYPRIGADDRNQFDFYRDMPGGLTGLREVVRQCHQRGVRTLVVYKPWDVGTRREPVSDVDALGQIVQAIGADGVYLDTMPLAPDGLRMVLDRIGPGLVLEGEGELPLEYIHDHHMSWAQYFADSHAPGVLRNKWYERRHMMHQSDRWNRDHTYQLHTAWMNGSGMVVWENVFGSWVGWSAHDRALLSTMLFIQRHFAPLFLGEGWTPLIQTEGRDVYATLWEGAGLRLWTLVNRTDHPVSGALLKVSAVEGTQYFDVVAGREMVPRLDAGMVVLEGTLVRRGIACFVAGTRASLGEDFSAFLAVQQARNRETVLSIDVPVRPVALRVHEVNAIYREETLPEEMVVIPAATVKIRMRMRTRECGFYGNELTRAELYADFHQPRAFERTIALAKYAIDVTPITNAQYLCFLRSTGYEPRHPENFLKHWQFGMPPAGRNDHPVVYVDLDDARAYAKWAGKRLPTEEEWQYAAQGPEALKYPWGNAMLPDRCNDGGESGRTTSVTAYPEGRSPFGCYDMCGNTWEWTDSERTDGRTRFCIIRGGSYYTARGSHWYMDGGPQPTDFATKFLLMWPGLDRCATIGFRCSATVEVP